MKSFNKQYNDNLQKVVRFSKAVTMIYNLAKYD